MKVRVSENGFPFVGRREHQQYVWRRVATGGCCAGCAVPDDATSAAAAEEGNNGESVFKTLRPPHYKGGRDYSGFSDRDERLMQSFLINRTVADTKTAKNNRPR